MKIKYKGVNPIDGADCTGGPGWFKPGNREALASVLTEEANDKRFQALLRGWQTRQRVHGKRAQGKGKVMTDNKRRKLKKRRRARLKQTVAKEAREIQMLCRQSAVAGIERVAEIAASSLNETASLQAITILLDRAYGKAGQTNTNINVDANGPNTEATDQELDTRIKAALKRIEELAGRKAEAPKSEDRPPDVCKLDRDPDSTTRH